MNEVKINDLLRYYYQELKGDEASRYAHLLKENARAMDIYTDYSEILDELSSSTLSPSQQTIDNILQYAKEGIVPSV